MCKYFKKIFKILHKSLMSTFLLNISPNRNFGDAIAVQDLSRINVWNFVLCPLPRTKILAPPLILILILRFLTIKFLKFCIQFCSSIKFYSVIFCIFYGILYFTTFKTIRFPPPPKQNPRSRYCWRGAHASPVQPKMFYRKLKDSLSTNGINIWLLE